MAIYTHLGIAGSPTSYWFAQDASTIASATATTVIVNLTGGTRMRLTGTGITFNNVGGVITLTGGTFTAMARENAAGTVVYETVTGIAYAATTFQSRLPNASVVAVAADVFPGADTFNGSKFDDFFRVYAGNDTVNGGAGFDGVAYGFGPNFIGVVPAGPITVTLGTSDVAGAAVVNTGVVVGGATVGTDTLNSVELVTGTAAADKFTAFKNFGGDGNGFNQFEGLGGNDVIAGNGDTRLGFAISFATTHVGAGATVIWTNSAANINGAGTATGLNLGVDTFTGVDAVRGSAFADTFKATGASLAAFKHDAGFFFDGRAGNDSITGGGTNVRWDSNTARYDFDTGPITVTLGTSSVVGAATTAAGLVTGGTAGTDTLSFVEGIRGTSAADTFTAHKNFRGLFGDFTQFQGMAGNDIVNGNGDTRVNYSQSTGGVVVTWTATPTAVFTGAGKAVGDASVGTDTFTGGVNSARGSELADVFTATGAHGFFTYIGGAGNDKINGGNLNINNLDFDTASYTGATAGVTVSLAATTTVTGSATVGTDTMVHVERFRGSHYDDKYTVAATFTASYGKLNVFDGGGGNDLVTGNGSTRLDFSSALAGVTVNLATGKASSTVGVLADIGVDTFTGVNGVEGSKFADVIIGGNGAQAEQLRGEEGADKIDGGGGIRDQVTYRSSLAGVVVNLTTNTATDGFGSTDTLLNIEDASGSELADTITGNALANYLIGQGGNDTLLGMAGNDILIGDDGVDLYAGAFGVAVAFDSGNDLLDGGLGSDKMQGGFGNDTYVVDVATDSIVELVGGGTDTVRSTSISLNLASYANVENATLLGAAALNITGSVAANVLVGNGGANIVNGGLGIDTMTGGLGNDTFVFNTALGATNIDRIIDYNVANDTIQLENAVFTVLPVGVLAVGAFRIGAAALDADDRILYNSATGALIYDSNGNVAGGAQHFATLSAGLALTNADFVVT